MNNIFNIENVLITGANGFVGKSLVKYLIENSNCNMLLIDQYFDEHTIFNSHRVELIKHDLTIPFKDSTFNIDIAIHLASIVGEAACIKNIELAFQVNTIGTINIIKSLDQEKLKKFILLSTSNIYSTTNEMPVNETGYINFNGIYASSKLASEAIVIKYFIKSSVSYYICRASNLYGPTIKANTIMDYILTQIVSNNIVKIEIPEEQRDFLFISDLISGMITLMDKDTKPGIYNIGGEESINIGDIPMIFSELLRTDITLQKGGKKGTILTIDSSKLKQYKWKPVVNFKNGLEFCLMDLINNNHYEKY